jgi:hypothetical protein
VARSVHKYGMHGRVARDLSDDELSLIVDELDSSLERLRAHLERIVKIAWRPLLVDARPEKAETAIER